MKLIINGYCCKCGKCCVDCDFLDKNNLCSVYKNREINKKCFPNFPDSNVILPEGCTYFYTFEEDNSDIVTIVKNCN